VQGGGDYERQSQSLRDPDLETVALRLNPKACSSVIKETTRMRSSIEKLWEERSSFCCTRIEDRPYKFSLK
jgi:hypothetical protein